MHHSLPWGRHLARCILRQLTAPATASPRTSFLLTSSRCLAAAAATTPNITLDSPELNLIRSKLVNNLKLSTDQANFAVLKCLNSEARFESENKVDKKIALIKAHFEPDDVCHNLEVLGMPLDDLENQINILLELGFDRLQIKLLHALPQLMAKTVAELKQHQLYPAQNNPCKSIVEYMQAKKLLTVSCDKVFKSQPEFLRNVDAYRLSDLRSSCLSLMLRQLLNCSEQVASHIVETFNCQRNFDQISFSSLISNVNVFINVIHLPLNQLIKHFVFFINYKSENLLQLANIKQFKESSSLRHIFFTRQRLLQTPPDQIKERVDLLVNVHRCSNQQLGNCITVLELTTEEIQANFAKFKQCDDLKGYRNNPNLLRLIVNIDLVLGNISKLADRNISPRHITLHNLLKSNSKFMNMVKNSTFQLTLNSFTTLHFDSPLKDIKNRIGWNKLGNRPLNSLNAENIINYFRQEQLTDLQIQNGIFLIYCQFETVKSVWEEMFQYEEVKQSNIDWQRHPYVLHLLHYFIERMRRF